MAVDINTGAGCAHATQTGVRITMPRTHTVSLADTAHTVQTHASSVSHAVTARIRDGTDDMGEGLRFGSGADGSSELASSVYRHGQHVEAIF